MKTKWTLLLVAAASGLVLTAAMARSTDLQPMVVNSLMGDLIIQQHVPCSGLVEVTTPVTQGRLELTPASGIDDPVTGGRRFTMTKASMSFAGFSAHADCGPFGDTRTYTEVGVELARAVTFTALPTGPGVYAMTIPMADFLINEASIVNDASESAYMKPGEDVTGTIDFTTHTFTMKVVVYTNVHFQLGPFGEDDPGTLTAIISGTIVFPDLDGDGVPDDRDNCPLLKNPDQKQQVPTPTITAPPNVTVNTCTDPKIGSASAADVCNATPVTVTSKAPNNFVPGKNLVTWTAQDAMGRTASATQIVTVVDTTPPVFTFVPANISVNTCGPVALGFPKAADDCGPVTFTNNAPKTFGVGKTVVTWTATDASGNPTVHTQTVTVTDTVAPVLACVATADPGARGRERFDIDDGFFKVSSSDACTASPPIRLGRFTLAQGEVVKMTRTRRPGVTRVGDVGRRHIRHFLVGLGENVITAADASGNVTSARCVVPR